MRRIGGHGVAIHESSGIEHAKAVTFESRLLGGRVPRHSEKVEDRVNRFHGRLSRPIRWSCPHPTAHTHALASPFPGAGCRVGASRAGVFSSPLVDVLKRMKPMFANCMPLARASKSAKTRDFPTSSRTLGRYRRGERGLSYLHQRASGDLGTRRGRGLRDRQPKYRKARPVGRRGLSAAHPPKPVNRWSPPPTAHIGLIGELRPLRGRALSHLIPRVPGLSRRPGADRR